MTQRGRYIAFEGWEASGKSTQAQLLAKRLDAVLTRDRLLLSCVMGIQEGGRAKRVGKRVGNEIRIFELEVL